MGLTSSLALEFETGFDHAMAFVHPPKVTSTGTKLESTALYEPKAPFLTVRPPKHKFVSTVRGGHTVLTFMTLFKAGNAPGTLVGKFDEFIAKINY